MWQTAGSKACFLISAVKITSGRLFLTAMQRHIRVQPVWAAHSPSDVQPSSEECKQETQVTAHPHQVCQLTRDALWNLHIPARRQDLLENIQQMSLPKKPPGRAPSWRVPCQLYTAVAEVGMPILGSWGGSACDVRIMPHRHDFTSDLVEASCFTFQSAEQPVIWGSGGHYLQHWAGGPRLSCYVALYCCGPHSA